MEKTEQLQQDLDYIASAIRSRDYSVGVPAIFFLWAGIVCVGFALPDLAPRYAGIFWLVCGIGGGVLSSWLGRRAHRRHGVKDLALSKRYNLHWGVGGIAFVLTALPMLLGRVPQQQGATTFLLISGVLYALAGIHLQRLFLGSGLLMLTAYAVLTVSALPYTWTLTGIVIALSLTWAGIAARKPMQGTYG